MLPFEMRTVLYRIHLFNDAGHKQGSYIYMKQKEGEREQNSGETEREGVREREGGSRKRYHQL
jgi:hypothetical protein